MALSQPHILILGDGFGAPAYNPRLRALCNYLSEQGYTFDLVVERVADLPFEHRYPIHEIALYSGTRGDWMLKNMWSFFTDWKNRRFSALVEQKFGTKHYDIVVCTTFYTFPLRAAVDFGRRHHIPVIADVRDLAEQAPGNAVHYLAHRNRALRLFVKPYRWINIRRRNRQLRQVTAITTVSPWHVDFLKHLQPNTYLVYNGFDEKQFVPADVPSSEFILSYCGNFFGFPIHDPRLLFEALAQLPEIPYKLHFYTSREGQALLHTMASAYGITDRIEWHDFVDNTAISTVYHQSSILLVFTNTASSQNVHGLMTTKFFEALGVEKPVLCVRSDEECLAQVIRDTNAGLTATTTDEVCTFIHDKYTEWKTKGFTRQPVTNKQFFSRTYQAQQIEKIILNFELKGRHLHIVSFDIPYPANYGGAIDVFYSLQALSQAGVEISLHCTYKGELTHYPQLEKLCREVFYYPRRTSLNAHLSLLPYGITSRENPELLTRLLADNDPILFEGLVSCGYIAHPALAQRKKIFRECNIEHDYLRALAKATPSWWKKLFFYIEAYKQKRFEPLLRHASSIAAVAHQDEQHFKDLFPHIPTYYIPSFHAGQTVCSPVGKGDYILYHGNLEVAENEHAALWLLEQVIPLMPDIRMVIAGRNPSMRLQEAMAALSNVQLEANPDEARMSELIQNAHIHLLPTFQGTGLKLKLLHVLYYGRWVVVNPPMVHGTDLSPLCQIVSAPQEIVATCRDLMSRPFTDQEKKHRQTLLGQIYNNTTNLTKLLALL